MPNFWKVAQTSNKINGKYIVVEPRHCFGKKSHRVRVCEISFEGGAILRIDYFRNKSENSAQRRLSCALSSLR